MPKLDVRYRYFFSWDREINRNGLLFMCKRAKYMAFIAKFICSLTHCVYIRESLSRPLRPSPPLPPACSWSQHVENQRLAAMVGMEPPAVAACPVWNCGPANGENAPAKRISRRTHSAKVRGPGSGAHRYRSDEVQETTTAGEGRCVFP